VLADVDVELLVDVDVLLLYYVFVDDAFGVDVLPAFAGVHLEVLVNDDIDDDVLVCVDAEVDVERLKLVDVEDYCLCL
jgi:hypothetical protein